MKQILVALIVLFVVGACNNKLGKKVVRSEQNKISSIQDKIDNLKNSKNSEVIVVAHRGDWRNAPENSLQAIQNCIDLGVDMVEIDVSVTKDGHLVLMHDTSIKRTTTGKGLVKEWTLESLKTLKLLDVHGVPTKHKIPTLKEALELAKGKILINLDKSYSIFDKCYDVIKETGTQDQVVIKGVKRLKEVEKEFGKYLDKVHFMPIIVLPNPNAKEIIDEYLVSKNQPVAFEIILKGENVEELTNDFKSIRESGSGIWVNALRPHYNGGHDDEKAVLDSKIYQWYIENHIDLIQTDRPAVLLKYLRANGLHK